jgi:hypothetical protein
MTVAAVKNPTPPKGWMNAIETPKDVEAPKSVMIYGLPGTRKTTIAATIAQVPGIKKVLFIDIDSGTEVLARKAEFENIDIIRISALASDAEAKMSTIINDLCASNLGYDAVVLDTLDVAQDVAEGAGELLYANSGKGGARDGFAVYRHVGEWTNKIVRQLHECPFFVAVITCHSTEKVLESGATRITPRLSGSSKDTIGGIPSIVAYLEFRTDPEGNRRLLASVGEQDDMITKNRFNLGDYVPELTMPELYRRIDAANAEPAPLVVTASLAA